MFDVYGPSVDKKEADITIIVQGVYKYKSMPFVKVLFADYAAAWELVTRNPSVQQRNCAIYAMVYGSAIGAKTGTCGIHATQKVGKLKFC